MFVLLMVSATLMTAPAPKKSVGELLAGCHRIASARNHKIHGKLHVKCTIGAGGKVLRVFIKKENVNSPLLLRCAKFHLYKQTFPGKKSVEFRFNFPKSRGQYAVWSKDVPINRSLGNGSASRVVLDAKSAGTKKFAMSIVRIAKKGRLTPRFHPKADTFLFIIDGSGQVEWAQTMKKSKYLPVSRGSAIFLPRGTVYRANGTSDPPLVMVVFHTPKGPEKYLAGGITGKHTVLIPPKGIPMTSKYKPVPGAGKRAKYKHINFSRHGKFTSGTVLTIPKIGTLGIQMAPKGKHLVVKPGRKAELGMFVVQGGGTLKNRRGSWPVQPGSGLYFPMKGKYFAQIKNIPLYAVWFSLPGKPRFTITKK